MTGQGQGQTQGLHTQVFGGESCREEGLGVKMPVWVGWTGWTTFAMASSYIIASTGAYLPGTDQYEEQEQVDGGIMPGRLGGQVWRDLIAVDRDKISTILSKYKHH